MPGLGEGIIQGLLLREKHNKEAQESQLLNQFKEADLKLRKKALSLDEEQHKYNMFTEQLKQYAGSLQTQDMQINPELIQRNLGSIETLLSQAQGTYQPPQRIADQRPPQPVIPATVPIPGAKEKRQAELEYLQAGTAERLRQAETPPGGEPSAEEQDIYSYQADERKKGRTLSFNQAKTELLKLRGSQQAQPGLTVDQILQKRQDWINRFPDRPLSQFYKESRLASPAVVDSLAAVEYGIPEPDVQVLLRYKDFGDWKSQWLNANKQLMNEQEQKDAINLAKQFYKQEVQDKF